MMGAHHANFIGVAVQALCQGKYPHRPYADGGNPKEVLLSETLSSLMD